MSRIDETMLMAYADGEVDAATARDIEAAIAGDPAVAARLGAMRETGSLLRAAYAEALHEPVPQALLATVLGTAAAGAVAAQAAPAAGGGAGAAVIGIARRAAPFRRVIPYALAASVAAGAFVLGTLTVPPPPAQSSAGGIADASSDRWLDDVAGAYKVYARTLAQEDRLLVDFNAEDIPGLEKWFGTRLEREMHVPDLSAKGYAAQGGRVLVINGRTAAQFVYYSDKGELVSLVIVASSGENFDPRGAGRDEVNLIHWRTDGYAYAVVGTAEPRVLRDLATVVRAKLQRT